MIPGARELFVLDPSVAHLNHGSFGSVPIVVREHRRRLLDEYDANPLRVITGDLRERIAASRNAFAGFLGAEPDLCALVPNVTQGVAVVLGSLDLSPGDEIVITDHSYNATTLAVQDLVARKGIRVVTAPVGLGSTAAETVAAITSRVTERTKLVLVDQISSATAQLHPVAEIAAALRAMDVPFLVDAAHAPGMLPRAVEGIDADFWIGNLHKWAYAPAPTALMRVARRRRDRMVPLSVSHHQPEGYPAHLEAQGTVDFTSWLAAPVGLMLFERFGEAEIQRHNSELAAYGQRVIGSALGLDTSALPDPGAGVSMRLIPLPDGVAADYPASAALRRRIADELRVETAINAWRDRGWLRISANIYNQESEYDRLAETLPGLLQSVSGSNLTLADPNNANGSR